MGGNIFEGKTERIKKEYIESTLNKYFEELSRIFPYKAEEFTLENFRPVGSVGKKDTSGDIDLAIDSSTVVDNSFSAYSIEMWGLTPQEVRDEYLVLKKRSRTATDNQLMTKAVLRKIGERINAFSDTIYCDLKKVTNGNLFAYFPQFDDKGNQLDKGVQIDWMVGNMTWLEFSYYSDIYKGNIKGLHRTQLILSMFNYLGYSFNHINGVSYDGTIVAETPQEAIHLLSENYHFTPLLATINDYFQLIKVVNEQPDEVRDGIIGIYLRILDKTRCDIPEDLQVTWLERQAELGLTGKFLPEDSNLYKELKENE